MKAHMITAGLVAATLSMSLVADAIAGKKGGTGATTTTTGTAACTQSGTRLPPYLSRLSLTDAQVTAITAIITAQAATHQAKFEEGMAVNDQLRQLAMSADYTDEKAQTLSANAAKLLAEASVLHAKMDHAIYLELTADQQLQLSSLLESGMGMPHGGPHF